MTTYTDSADLVIQSVQASYLQENQGFVWETLPRIVIGDELTGWGSTSYPLAELENTLTNGNHIVRFDADAPREQFIGDNDVVVKSAYNQTLVTSEPLRQSESHRLEDMERNVPKHLNQINIGYDLQVIPLFADTGAFSTETFSGTGALNLYNSDQNPVKDFLNALEPFRWLQSFTGLSLECYVDKQVALILAGYEDFQTALYASSGRQFVNESTLAAKMSEILDLDAVHIVRGITNTALPGLTAVGDRVGNGLLWFGLLDRRGGDETIMENSGGRGRDGGICIAQGTRIHMVNAIPDMQEVELMNARGGFKAFLPRFQADATQMGIFYPTSETLG